MYSNIITSIGVFLILVAYYLEVNDKIQKKQYFALNIIGSLLAGIGAYLVQLWPIVFLEVVWAIISLKEIFELKK
jgi:putative flippase GtrA